MKISLRHSRADRRGSLRTLTATCIGVLSLATLTSACGVAKRLNHESIPLTGPREIRSHAKVHLLDGSTIIYHDGVTIENGRLGGLGIRYDIRLDSIGTVSRIALDSVGAMENFETSLDVGRTVAVNTVPIGALAALILILDAIF